jgi:hypothetical protein
MCPHRTAIACAGDIMLAACCLPPRLGATQGYSTDAACMTAHRQAFQQALPPLLSDYGPSFEALSAEEKGQESNTSVSGEQIANEFIPPGAAQRMSSRYPGPLPSLMAFRSRPPTLLRSKMPNHPYPRQMRPILGMPISIYQRLTAA